MTEKYNVAIVMPIHNALKTFKRSFDSVLNQKNLPKEIKNIYFICVFNACKEDEKEEYLKIIKSSLAEKNFLMEILLINEDEKGIVPALNNGLFNAMRTNSKYIFRQDADDFWYSDKMTKQIEFMEKHSDIHVLGTGIRFVDKDQNAKDILMYPELDNEIKGHMLAGRNAIAHPTVVFRTEILKRVGGYDDVFPFAEDLNLWLRCVKWFNFANLQEVLLDYTQTTNPNYNPLSPQIAASNTLLALRYFGEKK